MSPAKFETFIFETSDQCEMTGKILNCEKMSKPWF